MVTLFWSKMWCEKLNTLAKFRLDMITLTVSKVRICLFVWKKEKLFPASLIYLVRTSKMLAVGQGANEESPPPPNLPLELCFPLLRRVKSQTSLNKSSSAFFASSEAPEWRSVKDVNNNSSDTNIGCERSLSCWVYMVQGILKAPIRDLNVISFA